MTFSSLTAALDDRAHHLGDRAAYAFLKDGETESGRLGFAQLRRRALAVALRLTSLQARGDRALLLYPQGLEFLAAFFGCLYAGVVAVPVALSNRKGALDNLRRVAVDAGARWLLSSGALVDQLSNEAAGGLPFPALSCLDTEGMIAEMPPGWAPPAIAADELALLQYTSGSTGSPRGVALTHKNLAENQRQVALCFGSGECRLVSWLPMFHDMGLGTVLQAVWAGGSCALLSPHAFLQTPRRWLEAIAARRATISGAPDFAFDLCVRRIPPAERGRLDLSSWRVAYNGSEPVRAATLARFAEAFAPSGFRAEAFHPVYGLAEATVLVASEPPADPPLVRSFSSEGLERGVAERATGTARDRPLVSCGRPWPGTRLAVVDPETREHCAPGHVGEIWVQGASVAAGYWNKARETEETFQATTAEGAGPFLRTGDLGFVQDGHLFLTGRRKDLVIVHGRNHYPQDIEDRASTAHTSLVPRGCAAFSIDSPHGELLAIVQEVQRSALRTLDTAEVVRAVRKAISDGHALQVSAIVLIKPSTLPRTSSGKVRRAECRRLFLAKSFDSVASWVGPEMQPLLSEVAVAGGSASTSVAPPTAREDAVGRADRLVAWLRQHSAEAIAAFAREDAAIPPSLLAMFARQGLLGMTIDPVYGGMGLGHHQCARVLEQLAAIDFRLAVLVGLHTYLGVHPIAKHARPALRSVVLPGLAHGEELPAFGLVEPRRHGAAATRATHAASDGPGRWRLVGTKYLHVTAPRASVATVFARHPDSVAISAFVVHAGAPELRQAAGELPFAVPAREPATMVLDGVAVGWENLLGGLGDGMAIAHESMLLARLAAGVACIGGMKRCAQSVRLHRAPAGSRARKPTPNPIILSRLGTVMARITALECLVHRVAHAVDGGRHVPAEAFSACRVLGPELLLRSVDDLLQLGGHASRAETERLAAFFRDVGLLRGIDGPPEAVSELTGGLLMEGEGHSLRRLLDEVFGTPELAPWVERIVQTVRDRMRTLGGALARRPARWAHTRAGELGSWLVLLAAVFGARREAPSAERARAHGWVEAQLEEALSAVRLGTPSETAAAVPSDVAAVFAEYARTIGELDDAPPAGDDDGDEESAVPWAGLAGPAFGPPSEALASREASVLPSSPSDSGVVSAETGARRRPSPETWILAWLSARLRLPVSEIDVGRSFADYGLDSVAAVELSVELAETLDCKLDETLLWNFPTIETLVAWARTGRTHAPSPFEGDVSLAEDIRAASPERAPGDVPGAAKPARSPLLTGATGFLGAFLLRDLLEQPGTRVTCLVRATDPAAARDRVVRNLRQYGLWEDALAPRITVLVGDLGQPRLGLDRRTFDRLAGEIDGVFNNGALLSFVAPYADMRPSHVDGTREILRLATTGRPKAIHHVSSVAVFDGDAYRDRPVLESTRPIESRGVHLPYAQCKWVSENLVWLAAARGVPVIVYRPGLIAGSSVDGAWNKSDFLCRMLKAMIEMRALPADLDLELDFSPVDYVSRALVHLSRRASSPGRAFHLQHPRPLHLDAFGKILRSLGYPLEPVAYRDWVKRIERRSDGPLFPLLPFLGRRWLPEDLTYVELAQRGLRARLRCDETRDALAGAGIECPAIDADLVGRYLAHLVCAGFIPPAPELGPTARVATYGRAG